MISNTQLFRARRGAGLFFREEEDILAKLSRFGVSMEQEFLSRFDGYMRRKGYKNRSEAIRDLIRSVFVAQEWQENEKVAGALLVVYDHHRRDLVENLLGIQHDAQEYVVSTQHIHLDHHNCLEIIVVRGRARRIQDLYDRIQALKGIKHASLSMATTGRKIL